MRRHGGKQFTTRHTDNVTGAQADLDAASKVLRQANNKEFPEGTKIIVDRGNGQHMPGIVAGELQEGTSVLVISRSGIKFRYSYLQVRRDFEALTRD